MASDKVFVDLDEEIVFTVEKILNAATKRVILVIPESANLVTSFISLKLLARQINRSEKISVLVTEDKLGLGLAKKAGLVAKEKISDITPAVWVEAEELKKAFLESRKELGETLIGARTEQGDYKIVEGEEESPEKKEISETQVSGDEHEYTPQLKAKPRLEPKVVNLGTIALVAGGDIEMHSELAGEIERMGSKSDVLTKQKPKAEKELEREPQKEKEGDEDDDGSDDSIKKEQAEKRQNVIGRDMSSFTKDVSPKRRMRAPGGGGGFGASNLINQLKEKILIFYSTGNTKLKLGATAIVFFILFFLLSTTVLASAELTIYVSRDEVSVSKEVEAKEGIEEVDEENLIIPVRSFPVSSSSSSSAETTGQAEDGNKAKGLITIYNKQESEVTLTDGTKVESIATGLRYKIVGNVTIPAAVKITVDDIQLGVKEDVQIEADSFGEKFNTSGSKDYKIDGYVTNQLIAKSFNDVTGGDTSEETAVAPEDITDLRDGLVDLLKNELMEELEQNISEKSGEILIEESITYSEPKVTADKKEGEVAETLNVTVDLKATAYIVQDEDLKKIIAILIKEDSEFDGEVDEDNLKTPVISAFLNEGGKMSFVISADGDITAELDKGELAEDISGKSIDSTKEYLDDIEGVEEYEINVKPFYVPSFLKKLPSPGKIVIVIKEAK